jgi:hypothetical protein
VSVWCRWVEQSGCEVALVGLASDKGALRLVSSYREDGEREEDVVSEGEVRCYPRRSDAARRKVRLPVSKEVLAKSVKRSEVKSSKVKSSD